MLLALAGVGADAVAADYTLSGERLKRYFDDARATDEDPVAARLAEHGTTVAQVVHELLTGLDVEALLHAAGLSVEDRRAVRARLVGV